MAVLIFDVRVGRSMVDFGVYRVAAGRALASEPLYREEDGHYKFKYLPAFAISDGPVCRARAADRQGAVVRDVGRATGGLCALVRLRTSGPQAVGARVMVLAVVLMAKFYGHEPTLGQSNILLGTVLVTALLAVEAGRSLVAGALFGLAVFVKPYAIILLPWAAVSCGLGAALVSGGVVLAGLLLPVATTAGPAISISCARGIAP